MTRHCSNRRRDVAASALRRSFEDALERVVSAFAMYDANHVSAFAMYDANHVSAFACMMRTT